MSVKLSICIPTYNRVTFLDEAIASAAPQVVTLPAGELELCISDNASSDGTSQMVESWRERLPIPIVYKKNEKNLGADANYLKVVEMASGEYCWYLGSDDRFEPAAIARVLETIQRHPDIDIFIFSRNDYSFDFSTKISPLPSPLLAEFSYSYEFTDTREAVGRIVYALGYLSILVFRKQAWDVIAGHEQFLGSAYVHVYKLLAMMKDGSRAMFVPEAVVGWRAGNDSFGEELKIFGRIKIDVEGFDRIGASVFGDFSMEHRAIVNCILQVQGKQLVYHLKYSSPTALLQWRVFWLYLCHYWRFWRFWLRILPLLMVPASFMDFSRKLFRWFIPKKVPEL